MLRRKTRAHSEKKSWKEKPRGFIITKIEVNPIRLASARSAHAHLYPRVGCRVVIELADGSKISSVLKVESFRVALRYKRLVADGVIPPVIRKVIERECRKQQKAKEGADEEKKKSDEESSGSGFPKRIVTGRHHEQR